MQNRVIKCSFFSTGWRLREEMLAGTLAVLVPFFLVFLLLPGNASSLKITGIVAYPNPLKVNSTNITVVVNVSYENESIGAAVLSIELPNFTGEINITPVSTKTYALVVEVNESGNVTNETINVTEFTFTYLPELEGTYWYRAYVNTTDGNITISGYYSFSALRYPIIHAVDITTPVKYSPSVRINITAYILPWNGETITDAKAEIHDPNGTTYNITLNYTGFDGTYYIFSGSFHPTSYSIWVIDHWEREYRIRIYATDNTSSTERSDYYAARAEDYPPEVVDVAAAPPTAEVMGVAFWVRKNTTLHFNITARDTTSWDNTTNNIVSAQLILVNNHLGINRAYNLSAIFSNGTYVVYNWSFNYTTPHSMYYFFVYLEDSHGNRYLSQPFYFSDDLMVYRTTRINLNVSRACCLLPVVVVLPKVMYEGQTFTIYSYVENCGSVPLNISGGVDIYKIRGNEWIHYETVLENGKFAYYNLRPGQLAGTYFLRNSAGYDEGNYSAVLGVRYYSSICYNRTNGTDFFQIKKFGGHGPMDLIVVREMPPKVSQPQECENNRAACNTINIRLFLYNRGTQNITNVSFTDTIQINFTSYPSDPSEAEPLNISCPSTYAYNCSVETKPFQPYDPTVAIIKVNVTRPISPRNYVMVSYNLTPSPYPEVYNASYGTKYTFIVQGTFTDSSGNTHLFLERMPYYNPPESYTLRLVNEPSFDYNLFVNDKPPTDLTQWRSFYALNTTTIRVVAKSISGDLDIKGNYSINITLPPIWKINGIVNKGDCDELIIQNYDFTHNVPYVLCRASKTLKNGDEISFAFNITSFIDDMFLLPAYGKDNAALNVPYLPGFFVVAMRPKNQTRVPKPQPQPQPSPQPLPQPIPQPLPQPKPKVEIVLTPIRDKYTAYQGQLIPTYFRVENIGNATAYNISIEPELPSSEWKFSPTYVDVLRPGERVNRTLMIAPGVDTPPGLYVIPVKAIIDGEVADLAYIKVRVLFGRYLAKIEIVEAPTEIEIEEFSNLTVPVLLKNVGRKKLHNVTMRLENVEECLSLQRSSVMDLNINETKGAYLHITAKEAPKKCKAVLIVSSAEGAYAFAPVLVKVNPRPPLMPLQWKWAPYLAMGWTALFVIYGTIRKRKAIMGERPRTIWPRVFIYVLLFGEVFIIIYILLWIFGYVTTMI